MRYWNITTDKKGNCYAILYERKEGSSKKVLRRKIPRWLYGICCCDSIDRTLFHWLGENGRSYGAIRHFGKYFLTEEKKI